MSDGKKNTNWLWPNVSTLKGADGAATEGALASFGVVLLTIVYSALAIYRQPDVHIPLWAWANIPLFAVIGVGIWRMSRTAAVVGLAAHVLEKGYQFVTDGSKGMLFGLFIALFLYHAVRGTFAYHKLMKARFTEAAATATT
jgi:hypothetical protein